MSETDRLLKVAEIDESGITITLPNTIPGKSSTPKNSPRSFDAVETLELENNENTTTLAVPSSRWEKAKMIFKGIKFLTLLLIFLTICIVFGTQFEPNEPDFYSLSNISNITVKLPYKEQKSHLQILLSSPIEEQLKAMSQDVDLEHLSVTLFIQTIFNQSLGEFHHVANHTMEFFKVNATHEDDIPVEDMFLMRWNEPRGDSRMIITTNSQAPIPLKVTILHQTVLVEYQVAIAFIIFIGVYSLIILDVVSRPLAGLIGVFAGITGLALVQQRPSIREMAAFVDWGALGLVFGMMLVFGIFKGSGVFEWSALRAYKLARGRMWPLMVIMSLFCFFVSMFIDNVTLMLLMTPITFQICEVIDINPLPLLITECLFGNIGGAGAPLSEEFVIILNNSGIQKYNLSFARSLLILFPGALLGALVCFIPVRLTNSAIFNKKAVLKPEKAKLLEQAAIWKKSLTRYHTEDPDATPEEQKVREVLLNHITSLEEQAHTISDKDEPNLENLEKQYRIHNKPLLIRSTIIISILLFLFVIESFIHPWIHLSLPWIALMGAVSLLLFSGIDDIEHVFQNEIEWPTMVFFVSLFILIECVNKLGMMRAIGNVLESLINSVSPSWKVFFAVSLILWVSAFVSAFVDNVPYITGMIPVILQLAKPPTSLPIEGILFALFYGVVVGGSGTLVGCSGNVIVADMAKKRGVPITFWSFLKISAPFTFVGVFVIWLYLVLLYAIIGL